MTTKAIPLQFGGPVPHFAVRSPVNARFHFDTIAGRYVVLCFFGSAQAPASRRLLDAVLAQRQRFDDTNVAFFGVSVDPEDEQSGRVREALPGVHFFWDFDGAVSRQFGALPAGDGSVERERFRTFSLVLDERLRVVASIPLGEDAERHLAQIIETLAGLPPLAQATAPMAPVLSVPRVFEPELCRALIRYYEERGGGESGFMREIDGKTVGVFDYSHKRRRDEEIKDEPLRRSCMVRVYNRLLPEIAKAFQFEATRIERYIVACYEAETGGHFRPHRDNTTKGTAHRRFAVSLVLNSEFEGGGLRFPEFGRHSYAPPAGGAVVFSCSLLHELTPVTRGTRYAFLPFLYDEAAARIREENLSFVASPTPVTSA
ncbi:MAG TPA: 2OG-Fe(II) oxygenase [Polyangiaceae bacterium]|nr:2OG-Fe(II) oxygenase [Polyangiaceae bacterium]